MLEILANNALRHAEAIKLDAIEIFLQKKTLKKIEISNCVIKNITQQEKSGYAIRAIQNNHLSFVSSNTSAKINEIVEFSAQNAKNSSLNVIGSFVNKKFITPVNQIRDNQIVDLSLEEIVNYISEILSSIEESKPVKNLDGIVLIETEDRLIANSEGLWKRELGTRMKADILTTIKINDFIGIGSSHLASRIIKNNWQELFNNSIKTAYNQKDRKKLSIGKPKGVIFSPEAFGQILAFTFIPSLFYFPGNDYSHFKNINLNDNLIMLDDPTFPGAQNTFSFDDEGYPTKPRLVFSGGKFKRLLGMNFSCASNEKREQYLGNCYRVANLNLENRYYSYPPTVSSSNFIIRAKKEINNLNEYLNNGIYIKEITGVQDANYYSGDFVISLLEGYEIKKGEIVNPIFPCFCSGNVYKILQDPLLLINKNEKEVTIPFTPINVLLPEILTSKIAISL